MTTPTPTPITAEEIRELFADLKNELAELRTELHTLRAGLQTASQPPANNLGDIMITSIIMSYNDAGTPTYKAKGPPFQKFGVKIWDEILPLLDIDPDDLKPGTNLIDNPIPARVLMGETTNKETGIVGIGPRKVIGKA